MSAVPPSPRSPSPFTTQPSTKISTLSLHDALPISIATVITEQVRVTREMVARVDSVSAGTGETQSTLDRKSTRLNSSHVSISYAVFCLKKQTHRTARLPPTERRQTSTACAGGQLAA